MKKFITFLFLVTILGSTFYFREELGIFYLTHFSNGKALISNKNNILKQKNEYYRDYNYNYVSITEDLIIKSKEQLINVYYTIINTGIDKVSFYCSNQYKNCKKDVITLANDQKTLSNINSFVHPYNSFSTIETQYDSLGKTTLKINKSYTEEQIKKINQKMDEIIKTKIKKTTDKKEIIKIIHDYIINNSKYDSDRSDKNIKKYDSNIAFGPLLEGFGLCGGYTDAMALFLDYYNIPNFKIISENHIWNAVYLDNKWYHLDLTWDDPVTPDKSNILEYNFFLISTEELEELNTNQHFYDKSVFSELS